MSELMTKEEVAKELLKPYFDNPSLCSVEEDGDQCLYNGPDGKMCVFARACTPEGREKLEERSGAILTLDVFGYSILLEKYRHIEDEDFWAMPQFAHDELSEGSVSAYVRYEKLTGEEYTQA